MIIYKGKCKGSDCASGGGRGAEGGLGERMSDDQGAGVFMKHGNKGPHVLRGRRSSREESTSVNQKKNVSPTITCFVQGYFESYEM